MKNVLLISLWIHILTASFFVIYTNKIVIQKIIGKSDTQHDKFTCLELYFEDFGWKKESWNNGP